MPRDRRHHLSGPEVAGLRKSFGDTVALDQPFTPFIEMLRGLLMGTAIGNSALLSAVWCALIGLVGFRWSMKLHERGPARS